MKLLKKITITQTISLNMLQWFGHVQRMEENGIPKRVLYMNLETTWLKGRPRNRWQIQGREDGRPVTHFLGVWVSPGPVWTAAENLVHPGIRSPIRPSRRGK
jgi:hypothetical protein